MDIKNYLKVDKKIIYFSLFLVILSISLFYVASVLDNMSKTSDNYSELIMLGKDRENNYVHLEINYLPYYIVKQEGNNVILKYYIAVDKDNYMYLVRLTDKTYQSIEKLYEENPDNFSYYLEGYIFKTTQDLKNITIEVYNDLAEQKLINSENFSDYFGKTYLDETTMPTLNSSVFLITAGILLDIISLTLIFMYMYLVLENKKLINSIGIEKLEKELKSKRTVYFNNLKLYLTNNFIMTKHYRLKIISYKDLIWIYHYNGILTNYSLIGYLKNKKKIIITTTYDKEDLIKIMKKIEKKNKDILVGYSKENIKKFKKYKITGE